jgi:flagellar assembly protein FliH
MGRVIKNSEASEVTSVSLDEEVLTDGADRIPAEQVAADDETETDAVAPQGRVLRAGEAGRSAEPVPVRPDEVVSQEAADDESTTSADDASPDAEDDADDASDTRPVRTDAEWREHLQEQVEAARAEGYEEGHDDGYEAGYDDGYDEAEASVRAELEEQHQQLIEDATRFEQLWETYLDEAEAQMVELTLDLAETIVDAPFTESMRQASEEAVVEAVTELSSAPPVTIRLHPVDCQRVRESGLMERLTENFDGLTLEPEPDFEEGDWSVSSPTGVVRRVRDEVLDTLRGELRRAISTSDADMEGASETAPSRE